MGGADEPDVFDALSTSPVSPLESDIIESPYFSAATKGSKVEEIKENLKAYHRDANKCGCHDNGTYNLHFRLDKPSDTYTFIITRSTQRHQLFSDCTLMSLKGSLQEIVTIQALLLDSLRQSLQLDNITLNLMIYKVLDDQQDPSLKDRLSHCTEIVNKLNVHVEIPTKHNRLNLLDNYKCLHKEIRNSSNLHVVCIKGLTTNVIYAEYVILHEIFETPLRIPPGLNDKGKHENNIRTSRKTPQPSISSGDLSAMNMNALVLKASRDAFEPSSSKSTKESSLSPSLSITTENNTNQSLTNLLASSKENLNFGHFLNDHHDLHRTGRAEATRLQISTSSSLKSYDRSTPCSSRKHRAPSPLPRSESRKSFRSEHGLPSHGSRRESSSQSDTRPMSVTQYLYPANDHDAKRDVYLNYPFDSPAPLRHSSTFNERGPPHSGIFNLSYPLSENSSTRLKPTYPNHGIEIGREYGHFAEYPSLSPEPLRLSEHRHHHMDSNIGRCHDRLSPYSPLPPEPLRRAEPYAAYENLPYETQARRPMSPEPLRLSNNGIKNRTNALKLEEQYYYRTAHALPAAVVGTLIGPKGDYIKSIGQRTNSCLMFRQNSLWHQGQELRIVDIYSNEPYAYKAALKMFQDTLRVTKGLYMVITKVEED